MKQHNKTNIETISTSNQIEGLNENEISFETTPMINPLIEKSQNTVNNKLNYFNQYRKLNGKPVDYFRSIMPILFFVLICSFTSLIFVFLDFYEKKWRCLFLLMIMIISWVTNFADIVIVSFFPLIFGPMLMIMSFQDSAQHYITTTSILYLTASIVGGSLTKVGLDRRFALFIIKGCSMQLFDVTWRFAIIAAILSMFISDSAAMTLVMPIVKQFQYIIQNSKSEISSQGIPDPRRFVPPTSFASPKDLQTCSIIIVAYATCIGGMSSMIGSTVSMAFIEIWERDFGSNTPLNFASWFIYGFPCAVINLLLCWICIVTSWEGPQFMLQLCIYLIKKFYFFLKRVDPNKNIPGIEEYNQSLESSIPKATPWSISEFMILISFLSLLLLLFTRNMGIPGFQGWGSLFPKYTHDALITTLIAFITFLLPRYTPKEVNILISNSIIKLSDKKSFLDERIMSWKDVNDYVQWGVIWIFGGGFAIAEMIKSTNLGTTIAVHLENILNDLDQFSAVLLVLTVSSIFTEFMSSTIVIQIFAPILNSVAIQKAINPLLFSFNSIFISANSLLLPISSTSNVMAYQANDLSFIDFFRSGILLKFASFFFIICYIYSYGNGFFDMNTFPIWALQKHD